MLKQWIVNRELKQGERLNLSEIETRLNVSRTPIKIALKRLELEGLIEIFPRSGTYISRMDVHQLEANYKIRSSYELYVALCLFKYLTADDYVFFKEVQQKMNQLVEQSNGNWQPIIGDYLDLDRQFHEKLVERGGPARMLDLFKQLDIHKQMQDIIINYQSNDLTAMHFEHQQILSSILDQSPERLNATLLNHLESARFRAIRYFDSAG